MPASDVAQLPNGTAAVSAQVMGQDGNVSLPATQLVTVEGTAPVVLSVSASPSTGDLKAWQDGCDLAYYERARGGEGHAYAFVERLRRRHVRRRTFNIDRSCVRLHGGGGAKHGRTEGYWGQLCRAAHRSKTSQAITPTWPARRRYAWASNRHHATNRDRRKSGGELEGPQRWEDGRDHACHERTGDRFRCANARAQRWRHRYLRRSSVLGIRSDIRLHGLGRAEHYGAHSHGRHSRKRRIHPGSRRQCRRAHRRRCQSRAANRYADARRFDCHSFARERNRDNRRHGCDYAQDERGGDGCWYAGPALERWRHGHLQRRKFDRHLACLRLYGAIQPRHASALRHWLGAGIAWRHRGRRRQHRLAVWSRGQSGAQGQLDYDWARRL